MGRYYSGDINGKFWFAVQSSDDAEFFGCEGEPLYWDQIDEGEDEENNSSEPYALYFNFDSDSLGDVEEGIQVCLDELGEYKEKFDDFFSKNDTYNDKKLSEETGCEMDKVKNLLEYYARLELGMKIKKCLDETGQCCFDAEL